MKKTTFKRKDGSTGDKYKLEVGDEFEARYGSPKKSQAGAYENWSLGINHKGQEMFVQLTKGQATKLLKMGDIKGKKLICYPYESHEKKCVGIKEA